MARRYRLRAREVRELEQRVGELLKLSLENTLRNKKIPVEAYESEDLTVYLFGERPLLFELNDQLKPLLTFEEFANTVPRIVVDMGAVPKICNGADIMAPGIRKIQGSFKRGDLVAIADERFSKTLAIAETIFSSEEISGIKSGRIARNLHFVGDRVWKIAKSLEKPQKS